MFFILFLISNKNYKYLIKRISFVIIIFFFFCSFQKFRDNLLHGIVYGFGPNLVSFHQIVYDLSHCFRNLWVFFVKIRILGHCLSPAESSVVGVELSQINLCTLLFSQFSNLSNCEKIKQLTSNFCRVSYFIMPSGLDVLFENMSSQCV